MPLPERVHRLQQRDDRRERLRAIIAAESLRRGESFTLASGRPSTFFFDMKRTAMHPEGISLIADILFEMIKEDRDVEYIGGLETGTIPIVAAVAARSWPERPVSAFFVRKIPKDHGTRKLIDGQFKDGATVILIEDVTTTGGSVMQAASAVREHGATVKRIISLVDREEGAIENMKRDGIEFTAVFTMGDFGNP
jgi:orotate phosphoribosyltransferase